ncbi:MAG: glycoside hydrolase family 31 protein [Saccharofermentanales bacterium]
MSVKTYIAEMMDDECWWGGCCFDGIAMPFTSTSEFTRVMNPNSSPNQAAPLLVSNKGRYIWSDYGFDFKVSQGEITIEHEKGEVVLKDGFDNLRGAYKNAQAAHFPAKEIMPPDGFFDRPQYNTWIELTYYQSQDAVLKYAQGILDNGFPPGLLMIDCGWHEYNGKWEFHPGKFPDPVKMVEMLHEMGFVIMLWLCPFVVSDSLEYRFLRDKGYLVKNSDGTMAIRQWWDGFSAVLDCTNPGAVDWLEDQMKTLMEDFRIDGFKMDAGDALFYKNDDINFALSDANDQSEQWALIGTRYPYNELRACWKCGGEPLVQRLCDKEHRWDGSMGVEALIPDSLAQGLIGHPFTCADLIGGGDYVHFGAHADSLDPELIVRYAQCTALMPMMQFSAAPWRVLDNYHHELCKKAAWLHVAYGETIKKLARQSAMTGEPIIRSMEYVFPDSGLESVKDQFMLGDTILVAPVIVKGAVSRGISFPMGEWIGDDGRIIVGGSRIIVDAGLERLPIYRLKR